MMIRFLAFVCALFFATSAGATCSSVPFAFVPGQTIASAQFNANFAALVSCANSIDAGQITTGTLALTHGGTGNTSFTAGALLFSNGGIITSNVSKLFWDNTNFRLGILTTNPLAPLEIDANASTQTVARFNSAAADTNITVSNFGVGTHNWALATAGVGSANTLGSFYIQDVSSAATRFLIDPNGNSLAEVSLSVGNLSTAGSSTICTVGSQYITSTQGFTLCASDARLKQNVAPVGNGALAKIAALKPDNFEFIATPGAVKAGLIAQDVMSVIPEAVTQNPDGYYSVDQAAILAYVVKAIQELAAR